MCGRCGSDTNYKLELCGSASCVRYTIAYRIRLDCMRSNTTFCINSKDDKVLINQKDESAG